MARALKILLILVVVSGAVLGAYGWLAGAGEETGGFKLVEVETGAITEKALAVGQVLPRLEFRVKSKISGIVSRCFVDVGDRVAPGDALFEITPDPTPAELVEAERRLESAETALGRAASEHRRARELAAQGILSREELEAAEEAYELARIERDRTRDALALIREGRVRRAEGSLESIIRAPAGGIVLTRPVNPGDPVVPLTSYQAGTELATIADMSDLLFKGTVDEIDVGKLREGLAARLKVGALPEETVTGALVRIAPQAIEKDGAKLFEVEIELDETGGTVLRAGYSATADLIVREKTDIVVVPERLVRFSPDGEQAFVDLPPATPGGEPREVEIETGLSDGLQIEVVSGLEAGQKIVEPPPRDVV
jgi:HlyD family secretion protein